MEELLDELIMNLSDSMTLPQKMLAPAIAILVSQQYVGSIE